MAKTNSIQEWCSDLNHKIHQNIYLDNFLLPDQSRHAQAFTSLDVIEDSQSAIEEFIDLPEPVSRGRSTLYIYGVLQALYCQQDGLQHFYEAIHDTTFKGFHNLIKELGQGGDINDIRSVRNEIAGHPSNSKNGKEFYFIAKGPNSKFNFEYAGYTPKFKSSKVDLRVFIEKQNKFCNHVLQLVENKIQDQIMTHKAKFSNDKLKGKLDTLSYAKQQIFKSIHGQHPLAEMGYKEISQAIIDITTGLNARYNNDIPEGLSDTLRLINYALQKVRQWISNSDLYKNTDAEIFMDSLSNQLNELGVMLEDVDQEFSLNENHQSE